MAPLDKLDEVCMVSPQMLWVLALLACVPLCGVLLWLRGRRQRRLTRHLPGWPTLPFLGNAHLFYGGPEVIFKRLVEMSETADARNSAFKVWFGPKLFIMSLNPEDTKAVTNAFIEKPTYYRFARRWLGDGLVTGPSAVWKHNIKNLGGTFSGSVVDGFQEIFNQQAGKVVENLRAKAGQPPFDALEELAYITLETICQTAMGCPDTSSKLISSEYYQAFNRCLALLIKRGFNILLHPDCIYQMTPGYFEFKGCVKVIHSVSETLIKKRRIVWEFKKKNGTVDQKPDVKRSKFRPFLDILMELSELDPLLTDAQIRAEVDTVILGGQETTASTLFYTLLMLGCHDSVQEKLFQEMKAIFGDSKRPVKKEDLSQMKYCEAVIFESLRLFPPLPAVLREVDYDLKLENYTLPAGSAYVVNAWGSGRSRRIWGPDAAAFRPERWLDGPAPQPANFLPFSYGRRSCIGKKYAVALLKTILARCVRELVLVSEAQEMKLKFDIALRPLSGHHLRVRLRP